MSMELTLEPITIEESARLVALESVIKAGIASFIEVGEALMEIQKSRLYRSEYGAFEAYCQKKWGMTRRYANYLIGSAKTVDNLGTIVPK